MPEMFEGVPVGTRATYLEMLQAPIAETGALLLMDKPSGWTSFDVVAKTRNLLRVKKVGHTGTLDPMATGLLVICLGRATKLAERIQGGRKTYTGTIRFGTTTTTDDAEGEVLTTAPLADLDAEHVRAEAATFIGEGLQRPPMFSARKVGGERLYKIARRGEEVEVGAAAISVYRFDITHVDLPDVGFLVECSKGTYIRSLARDLGARLGPGAHLAALRRTHSGEFDVAEAITIAELTEAARREDDRSVR